MAEPSTHINYSFEDIQRYLQGKMSATEMHDIEKAALQDPFLADAIEGFNEADLTTAQQHLNDINTSLLKEKKESKVVAFNRKTRWLSIAAVVIVLAGIGVVASFFLRSSNQQLPIAQVKKESIQNNVVKDSAKSSVNALTGKQDTNSFIAENKAAKKAVPIALNKNTAANKNVEDNNDVASVSAAPVQLDRSSASVMMDTSHYNLKTTTAANNAELQGKVSGLTILPSTFSGKVVDENNEPVPFATIRVNDKQAVAADARGFFSLTNKDTALFVTTSAIGYANNASVIEPVKQNLITLNKNNFALNETVVTTALGVSGKQKLLSSSLGSDSAMPVGGWDNFNHYVLNQLNKDSTKENYMTERDQVELEFLIDKAGNPYNITIIKPLDEERNSKAIDILKSGPKWTSPSKKKKAKVSIAVPHP